ncbi:hypothetical protein CsSME_00036884 [Camellia sinensis var. sinensis]
MEMCSVRVSNELGAAHPTAAKFSAMVVAVTSFLIGLFLALILIIGGKEYPSFFSNDAAVKELVYELTPLLGLAIVVYSVQLALAALGFSPFTGPSRTMTCDIKKGDWTI